MQLDAHAPATHTCCAPHATPQAPQFLLSLAVLVQYAALASAPASSVDEHSVSPLPHVLTHCPPLHTLSWVHEAPQVPQLALSLSRSTQ